MSNTGWGGNPAAEGQIDGEHRELIAQVNEFLAAVDADAPRAILEIQLTQLIEGFRNHFVSEEDLMRSSGFPAFEVHADEHRKLLVQISELRNDLASGVVRTCPTLVLFMRVWTEQHITGMDNGFLHFLQNKQARREPELLFVGT
jgi:hemerythrin-like metal-binding protein